ncbi:helix-turn-helix domain-containing protein [Haloferula sp. BvORR071]|uniref:helix-turn-helix domain-containing protein n=1 Tax=Haloferula sp. BvORR071 TaxID=1396141 RepID=UPI00054E5134|nr:helix-turn-helix domain-containing protein [Haloferula sp. BvORR071]
MLKRHDTQETQEPAAGTQAAKAESKSPTQAILREWIRPKEVIAGFGISRTRLYALIGQGKIDSVRLESPGEKQGTRIIRLASLNDYLETLLAEQQQQQAAKKGGAA